VFVVVKNDYSGDEFFAELESFQDFETKVLQELQKSMKEKGVPAKDISSYMKEGGPLTFGPTGDRSLVAQLNGFTRRFKDFTISTLAFLEMMDQRPKEEGRPLHFGEPEDDFLAYTEKTRRASNKKQQKPSAIRSTLMIALNVELKLLGHTKVKRSFFLPLETNFAALSQIIQIGFGWSDTHLHDFDFKEYGFRVETMENNPLA
jgi:hypothetical protein